MSRPTSTSPSPTRTHLWAHPAMLLTGVIFLATLCISLLNFRDTCRSADWPKVPCTILSSTLSGNRTHRADITFRYEYGGRSYTSDRYRFTRAFTGNLDLHADAVRRFPPGTHATCYVNPDNPSESVLDRSFPKDFYAPFGRALLFLLVALGVLYLRSRASQTPPHDRPATPVTDAKVKEDAFVP